jgi:transcriptional regulator with XRE-family HTH domain
MIERGNGPTKVEVAAAFGAVLQRRRRARGLTQERLAEEGRVTPQFVSMLERGQHQPSLHTLLWLARGLGDEPLDLLRDVCNVLEGR